jgi:3D (Asp-Asp-Asp) domain-containing protein
MSFSKLSAVTLLILLSSWIGAIDATAAEKRTVQATAYTHTDPSQAPYGNKNAIGTRLRFGRVTSAASDWSIFPLGTQFRINGSDMIYEVDK